MFERYKASKTDVLLKCSFVLWIISKNFKMQHIIFVKIPEKLTHFMNRLTSC